MNPVVVTVVGPRTRRDLSLPADVAIGTVLPTLIQLTGGGGGTGDWRLSDADGRVLSTDDTLVSAGVDDGSIVVLDRSGMTEGPAIDAPPLERDRSDGLDPLTRTSRLLPVEHGWSYRLKAAIGAAFSTGEAPRPGPLTRMRRQWRDSAPDATLARAAAVMAEGKAMRIGVVSTGSGSGSTLVTRLLTSQLAVAGHGRTVAVDTDHKSAALSRGATSPKPLHFGDVTSLLRGPALSFSEVERRLARDDLGVGVVVNTPNGVAMDPASVGDAISGPARHCGAVVVDAGRVESATAGAVLAHVDLVVLVTRPDEDEALIARAAGVTLNTGRPVVTVVNQNHRSEVPHGVLSMLGHSSAMVTIPSDRRAAELLDNGQFRWEDTNKKWRLNFLRLAAVVSGQVSGLVPPVSAGER